MNRRILFTLCAILVVVLMLSTGCLPKDKEKATSTPAAPIVSAKDVNQDTKIANLQKSVDTLGTSKANDSTVQALRGRIDTLEGQSSANSYTKSQLYTRAEVEAMIQSMKDDQAWITRSSSSSGVAGVTGDYGILVDTDGDLELWLEQVSGDVSDELRTRMGKNEGRFDFVVVNLDADSSHDFKVYFDFEPDEAVELSDNATLFNTAKTYTESSGSLDFNVSRSPNSGRSMLSVNQDTNGRILKGDAEDYTVWITVDQSDNKVVDWEYDIRIKDRD